MGKTARPRLSEPTLDVLDEIIEEYSLQSYDQAVRHLARKADYDI